MNLTGAAILFEERRRFFEAHLRPEFVASEAGRLVLSLFDPSRLTNNGDVCPIDTLPVSDILGEVEQELEVTEMYAQRALEKVNPRTVRALGLFEDAASRIPHSDFLRNVGYSRFVWAVGAAGGGDASPGKYLDEFLELAAQWTATQLLGATARPLAARVISDIVSVSTLLRVHKTRTRFWWLSLMLSKQLLRNANSKNLPETVIDELAEYVKAGNIGETIGTRANPMPDLSDNARRLATSRSVRAGEYAGMSLMDLFYSRTDRTGRSTNGSKGDLETRPFIISGGIIVPASVSVVRGNIHVTIMAHLRECLGDKVASTCQEQVCADLLRPLATGPDEQVLSKVFVKIDENNRGQTDFGIKKGKMFIVGESKSFLDAAHPRNTQRSYAKEVSHTIEQINLRVDAVAKGTPLSIDGRMVPAGTFTDQRGLGVTLHDYGGGIWNTDHLDSVRKEYEKPPIVTLEDLAMITHVITDLDEFLDYLDFRGEVLSDPHQLAFEELDILAGYLEGVDGYQEDIKDKRNNPRTHKYLMMRPCVATQGMELTDKPPSSREMWRFMIATLPKLYLSAELL